MKILYGIQPTGKIHIGNYLGGLKNAIEAQEKNDVVFLVANYHAQTTQDENSILKNTEQVIKTLKKLGAKNIKFQKSINTKLAWDIMCITPFSEMSKMTQFKSKGEGNVGLFSYPCLMAADIILSGCDAVMVGEDQLQHMEFYRKTCKRLKVKYAKTILSETPRIMSIKFPTKKMSKSLGEEHCIYIGEKCDKKIMKAPTDKEGLNNLKMIANQIGAAYDPSFKIFKENIIKKLYEI